MLSMTPFQVWFILRISKSFWSLNLLFLYCFSRLANSPDPSSVGKCSIDKYTIVADIPLHGTESLKETSRNSEFSCTSSTSNLISVVIFWCYAVILQLAYFHGLGSSWESYCTCTNGTGSYAPCFGCCGDPLSKCDFHCNWIMTASVNLLGFLSSFEWFMIQRLSSNPSDTQYSYYRSKLSINICTELI